MTQDKTPEVGTLRQLNVQPGDVVEWIKDFPGEHMAVADVSVVDEGMLAGQIRANLSGYGYGVFGREIFRIISRAAPQSDAAPATKWDAMTDAERVTAVYEGLKGTRMGEGMDRVKAVLADLGAIKPKLVGPREWWIGISKNGVQLLSCDRWVAEDFAKMNNGEVVHVREVDALK